jgi:DNA-binding IclR family transcriptional regulator
LHSRAWVERLNKEERERFRETEMERVRKSERQREGENVREVCDQMRDTEWPF